MLAQRAKSGGALDLCLTLTVSIVYGCSLPSSMLIRQKKTKPKQCILGFLFKVHKGESARAQGNAARPTIRPLFILFLLLDILTICKRFRNASNVLNVDYPISSLLINILLEYITHHASVNGTMNVQKLSCPISKTYNNNLGHS